MRLATGGIITAPIFNDSNPQDLVIPIGDDWTPPEEIVVNVVEVEEVEECE